MRGVVVASWGQAAATADPRGGPGAAGLVIAFRAGSTYESDDTNGVFHLCEHLILGDGHPEGLAAAIEECGGVGGGVTSRDFLAIYAKIPSNQLEDALEACLIPLARFHQDPSKDFNTGERLAAARQTVEHEIRLRDANPRDRALDAWFASVWAGHPLSLPPVGSLPSVRQLPEVEIMRTAQLYINGRNMVVVCVGDVDLDTLAQRILTKVPCFGEKAEPVADPSTAAVGAAGPVFAHGIGSLTHVVLGFAGMPIAAREAHVLKVIGALLGGTRGSRLLELRFRGGVYSLNTFVENYHCGSAFIIHTACDPAELGTILHRIGKELVAVRRGEIGSAELAQTQRYLKGKAALEADDVLTRATAIARRALYATSDNQDPAAHPVFSAVGVEDVRCLAHQVLDPARFCAVFAGAVNEPMAEDAFQRFQDALRVH